MVTVWIPGNLPQGLSISSGMDQLAGQVTTSTAEAEYVGECHAAKEATFLVQALREKGYESSDTKPVTLLADNQAAIKMASNPINHPRSKHIDVSYRYVRWKVAELKEIELLYISTDEMHDEARAYGG